MLNGDTAQLPHDMKVCLGGEMLRHPNHAPDKLSGLLAAAMRWATAGDEAVEEYSLATCKVIERHDRAG